MSRGVVTSVVILVVNLLLAVLMYQSVGWHFIRGCNEVGNFVVAPLAITQGCLNLLLATPILSFSAWRRSRGGRITILTLVSSAVVLFASPLFAPIVGCVAKQNLWIETPIFEAARYGDAPLVTTLVSRGADPNSEHPALGTTALHYMAARGEVQAVEWLLTNGADPNSRADTSLQTPLHWAIRHRANVTTLEVLLRHGADPTLKDWNGQTPPESATFMPDPALAKVLKKMGWTEIHEGAHSP